MFHWFYCMLIFSSSLCWPLYFVAAQVDVGNLDSILLKSTTSLVLSEQGRTLHQMYLQNQPFADSKYQTMYQMFSLSLYWTLCVMMALVHPEMGLVIWACLTQAHETKSCPHYFDRFHLVFALVTFVLEHLFWLL